MTEAASPASALDAAGRPLVRLPLRELLQLSVYWLGINAIWAALGLQALPNLVQRLLVGELGPDAGVALAPTGVAIIGAIGVVVAIVVQPTFGSVSDYTISRFGRRKPYILVGTILDVAFLVGIAYADRYGVLLAFVVLLQFSSNMAQGPFQGYVPDLVPARQVGLASGLMGLMIVLGQALGAALVFGSAWLNTPVDAGGLGIGLNGDFGLGLVGAGVFELATALATVFTVREGRAPKPREGRSWLRIARSTWGTDILRERSYAWLLVSRLFFLTAAALLPTSVQFYMQRSLGLTVNEALGWVFVATAIISGMTALAVLPSGLLSNRYGRKRMIYVAAGIAAAGMAVVAVAPSIPVALLGAIGLGIGAGTFLSVDWALMTDIIPKASAGRYMGISNVATGLGTGVVPLLLGGLIMTSVSIASGDPAAPLGPRLAVAVSLLLFVAAVLTLRPVDERRREDEALAPAAADVAAGTAGA